MKILLIEDDSATAEYVARGLREAGHLIETAAEARTGLDLALGRPFDILVVDRTLGPDDGLGVVKRLRRTGLQTPVLFLTALDGIDDRVQGLEAGGDDYLVKPFALPELLARIGALARRPPMTGVVTVLRAADLEMDLLKRTATRGGARIELQPREFQILEYLMKNAGRIVTRTMLLEHIWDFHFDPKTNIVETHISRLRAKVDRGHGRDLIHTVRGAGYILRES
jgi:two-component system, OmpR family, response regulator